MSTNEEQVVVETPAPAASTGEAGAPALELRGVTAGYGNATVLRDIDLTVMPGQVVALLGSNGAGKTTLLSVAAGLVRPSGGSVLIHGEDATRRPCHQRVRSGLCLVPEGRGIFRRLTVRENLELQVPPWDKETSIEVAVDAFPVLGERMKQLAGTLSGGQQQMLALARAYLANPSLVMLDEVSMGLAPRIVDQIFESLDVLAAKGVALLVVEQYINRALAMAAQVYVLQRGMMTFSGPASGLDEATLLRDYLGTAAEA
ncbi:MAG TPA: ABC transporter ATP-binding protein [Solirubrobacteraceae bacterium]|nr:ABC transporter ATP-binding protein [Solirubrobacteraceae bacterium]